MNWAAHLLCELGGHKARGRAQWNQGLYFSRCRRCGRDLVREASGEWHVPEGYRIVWRKAPLLLTNTAEVVPSEVIEAPTVEATSAPASAGAKELAAEIETAPIADEVPVVVPASAHTVEEAPSAPFEVAPAEADMADRPSGEIIPLEWPFGRERRAQPPAAEILPIPELERRQGRQVLSWRVVESAAEPVQHASTPEVVEDAAVADADNIVPLAEEPPMSPADDETEKLAEVTAEPDADVHEEEALPVVEPVEEAKPAPEGWEEFMADDSDATAWEDLLRDPPPPEPVPSPGDFMSEEEPAAAGSRR